MQQAAEFFEECEVLNSLVSDMSDDDLATATQFKQWRIEEIIRHLHFWNLAADMSLNDPEGFVEMYAELQSSLKAGKLRDFENSQITEGGRDLVTVWREFYRDMAKRWAEVDPKTRVKWAGPEMSVRSSMSARQMEHWAHGQAVFDLCGKVRPEGDRIRNVVMLGVNAFGWSHLVHGLEVPGSMPKLTLVAPSGDSWGFGEGPGSISGSAVEFCQVVTQTRNIADTSLQVDGKIAETWMANAQCFAGPPETPPPPGSRFAGR